MHLWSSDGFQSKSELLMSLSSTKRMKNLHWRSWNQESSWMKEPKSNEAKMSFLFPGSARLQRASLDSNLSNYITEWYYRMICTRGCLGEFADEIAFRRGDSTFQCLKLGESTSRRPIKEKTIVFQKFWERYSLAVSHRNWPATCSRWTVTDETAFDRNWSSKRVGETK